MKLAAREAARFWRAPGATICGALLHGADEGLVALRRRELCAALLDKGPEPPNLTRLEAAAVRRDPALLDAALRAKGFFGGRPVVLVEGATDALTQPLAGVAEALRPDDGFLILCAGNLKGRSTLRKMFEGARNLVAVELRAEAPGRDEVEARLREHGHAAGLEPEAWTELEKVAAGIDRASLDRLLECLALYRFGSDKPLTRDDVRALAPAGLDAELDAFVVAVAAGDAHSVGPLLRRLAATGAAPVSILLGLQRHFRHMLIAATPGSDAPPIWGPLRDTVMAQARRWRRDRIELAARTLYEADARVRSTERVPAMALVERCALRLAMLVDR